MGSEGEERGWGGWGRKLRQRRGGEGKEEEGRGEEVEEDRKLIKKIIGQRRGGEEEEGRKGRGMEGIKEDPRFFFRIKKNIFQHFELLVRFVDSNANLWNFIE